MEERRTRRGRRPSGGPGETPAGAQQGRAPDRPGGEDGAGSPGPGAPLAPVAAATAVSEDEAAAVVAFLNEVRSPQELAAKIELPGRRDVGLRVAERILDRRASLGGRFRTLDEVAAAAQVGPVRLAAIVESVGRQGQSAPRPPRPQEPQPHREARLNIHKLLAANPNYFGTAPTTKFPVVQPIKYNTTYEELTCVGLWPERNLLEATIVVKLPFGFLGDLCGPGSHEYVRFFIDWDNDGTFGGPNEDLGVASVNVHDIPQVKEHPLCYAVARPFRPFLADCRDPYIVRLRAILSWEVVPPPGNWNFVPVWGNVLDCWVQVDPVEGKVLGVVVGPNAAAAANEPVQPGEPQGSHHERERPDEPQGPRPERERVEFLALLQQNPNYFGTLLDSPLQPVLPLKYDTRYEELKCIGLYPERNLLEAVLHVKLPYGFLGDLCSPGSHEYVRFYIDWNGDGDFVDFNEDAGVASVNVHDIPQVRQFHLCYALGRRFRALRANCQKPYIVRVRAILSWQQVPTGPNFIPVWGNVVECWVQIKPTETLPTLAGTIDSPAAATPPVCVAVAPTATCGLAGVTISGTAGGSGFSSYRIEYRALSSPTFIQTDVIYPDCTPASVTPDHSTARFAEPLAYLTNLSPDEYEVRLRVDGSGGPIFAFTTFSLHQSPVAIDAIGQVPTRVVGLHPSDPTELLQLVKLSPAPGAPETSVGGAISIVGSADFYGCGRQMIEYVLQYREATFGVPPPQQDAPGPWNDVKPPLPFGDVAHPRWHWCWPSNRPNFVLNGKLTRIWINDTCLLTIFPSLTYHSVRRTAESAWNTSALNGRYTVRLRVRHQDFPQALPVEELLTAATVWLDNRDIQVVLTGMAITGGAALGSCDELSLSQFLGTTAAINGRAWDPLILNSVPATEVPNDNFDHYEVSFAKDGGPFVTNNIMIPDPTQRVPNVLPALPPPPGDVGTLATWDIVAALDAGPAPTPYVDPPYPKIYRGERCAYLIRLFATDKTLVHDAGTTHHGTDLWPFCIVNDL